jgi:hypothetical protein
MVQVGEKGVRVINSCVSPRKKVALILFLGFFVTTGFLLLLDS